MKILRIAGVLLAIALIAACLILPGVADRAFYGPLPKTSPLPHDPTYQTTTARIPNGDAILSSWILEPLSGKPKATVVFAHGNGGNLEMNIPFIGFLPKYGFRVVMFDYQGFGDSTRIPPTRFTTHSDVLAAIDYAHEKWGKVFLVGHSLGAALAISTAPERKDDLRGVLAMAPFSSYREIARLVMGHIPLIRAMVWPVGFFVRTYKDPVDMAAGIAPVPLLIIHGEKDGLIPPTMSQEIIEKAGNPKELMIVPGMPHEVFLERDPKALEEALTFLSQKET